VTETAGLGWAKGQKPNPGPVWCTKPRPCDYDKHSSYCPHRECRQRLEALLKEVDNEATRLAVELSNLRAASREDGRT
jgi:hypothetical protein